MSPPRTIGRPWALVWACAFLCAAPSAHAESAFEFAYPLAFGNIPASSYDERGDRIGSANVVIEFMEQGRVQMIAHSSSRTGAHTVAKALFEPLETGHSMRLIQQESASRGPEGQQLGHLVVDHVESMATCIPPGAETAVEVAIPQTDRIVNVPMNLLFRPLVSGEARSVKFQLFLCRDGARTMDFEAWVAPKSGRSKRAIEVRYAPDFGNIVSMVARNFVPRLSFWFDRAEPHTWMGHRLPLYSGGPEVFVIREGVPSGWIVD